MYVCVCVLGQHAGHVFVIKLILSVRQSWVFTWSGQALQGSCGCWNILRVSTSEVVGYSVGFKTLIIEALLCTTAWCS